MLFCFGILMIYLKKQGVKYTCTGSWVKLRPIYECKTKLLVNDIKVLPGISWDIVPGISNKYRLCIRLYYVSNTSSNTGINMIEFSFAHQSARNVWVEVLVGREKEITNRFSDDLLYSRIYEMLFFFTCSNTSVSWVHFSHFTLLLLLLLLLCI